ncbi:deoxyribodipyrimidine photo-lyase [Shewanella sp. ULN5]|uniref:deoxyribodipyrimidine photo-lyase n=1 Tax=Shewanella TaxID=22 RepID=UPI003532255D
MSSYRSLFCFSNDLRLKDNLALSALIRSSSNIAFVFVFDESNFKPIYFQQTSMGKHRLGFLLQSLEDLSHQLEALGHKLHLCYLVMMKQQYLNVFKGIASIPLVKLIPHCYGLLTVNNLYYC